MGFKKHFIISCVVLFVALNAQSILPGQKTAIQSLANSSGFTSEDLNSYLIQNYGKSINELSRNDGADIIKGFQNNTIKKPSMVIKSNEELDIASTLEPGMKKRFHFSDGTIKEGEILSITDGKVMLKTQSGTFNYPETMFLSETAEVTNKKGESFKGVVLGETLEEFIIRTPFGDAIIQKRDVQNMKRYHGGILDKKSDERRQFYQSEAQLIGVFTDPTAFPLMGNTFYISGLSVGYGLTDRFMLTTKFGSAFDEDLNVHARLRFYHKKSASKEVAASWGLGLHRGYPSKDILNKYSHAIKYTDPAGDELFFHEQNTWKIDNISNITKDNDRSFYAETYFVFSSRRVNPTGRGKVGWTLGTKISNAFVDRNNILIDEIASNDSLPHTFSWSQDGKYKVPFRTWVSIEYDLRKDLKFVSSAWLDNGWKAMPFNETASDYFGFDGSDPFKIESDEGKPRLIDFDFGILYAVNENFRFGVHFQQPYLDIYWEFFEF